jgi:hypothetical protein
MKKSLIALALLTAAIASPALAQSRVQNESGIYSGAPAGSDAVAYHQQLAENQGS